MGESAPSHETVAVAQEDDGGVPETLGERGSSQSNACTGKTPSPADSPRQGLPPQKGKKGEDRQGKMIGKEGGKGEQKTAVTTLQQQVAFSPPNRTFSHLTQQREPQERHEEQGGAEEEDEKQPKAKLQPTIRILLKKYRDRLLKRLKLL